MTLTRRDIYALPDSPAKRSMLRQLNAPATAQNQTLVRRKRGEGAKSQRKAESRLEAKFDSLWKALGGPELAKEYRALSNRRFRWDRAHLPSRLLIEINGGTWGGPSGHNSGVGISRDAEKARLATLAGWRCVTLTTTQVTAEQIQPIVDLVKQAEREIDAAIKATFEV